MFKFVQIQLDLAPEDLDTELDKHPDRVKDILAHNLTRIRLVLSN